MSERRLPAGADDQLLLTLAEAASVLRISRWTVTQLVNRNELSTIKIGSRRLVPTSAVREFISRHTTETRR